ncbi:MAG TPA: ATP-binding protein [Stellaceae bacterium]|nr:ATP-binding protein [Stellaceae bacterium]
MKLSASVARRFHSSARLTLVGVVVVGGIMLAAGFSIWNRREDALARSRRETTNLSIVLAAQSGRALQAVDLVLQEMQGLVRGDGIATPDQFRDLLGTEKVHRFIADRLRSLPQADAVSLIDDRGMIVNFSQTWPIPRIDTSDRDFYAHFRDHNDPDLFIGKPVVNKVTGGRVITLTRRITAPGGAFLGIVLGVVETGYFEQFYKTIATLPGESVALFRSDSTILARYPHRDTDIGRRLPPGTEWFQVAEHGGTFRSPGHLDGVPRIVAVHPVGSLPLVTSVAITEQAVLADWRRQSTWLVLGALAAAVGFVLLFRAVAAQSGRLERQAEDLRQAAGALRRSEARFRDFAVTSSDWLWETDTEHRFTYLSDNIRNFGQNPETRLGRTRMELAADITGEEAKWEQHRAVLDRHEPFRDFVYRRRVGDDPEGYICVSGKPIFDGDGRFLGYRGTVRDITREVLSERSLREAKSVAESANLAKSQFLANMSHELRTPLNAILGFSEMLQHGLAGPLPAQALEYSGLINESGRHLLNVINEILDLARVDAGKLELREEQGVDPQQLIDSCVRLVSSRSTSDLPTLTVEIESDVPMLTVDPTRLMQVLLNLLSNAVKFTSTDGTVTVALHRCEGGGVKFEVRDTGLGMTAAEVEIALEPFGQIDSSHARHHEGTGLGLPLARRLAELHGGTLTVRSEKGGGTVVAVVLPASRVEAARPKPPAGATQQMSAVE